MYAGTKRNKKREKEKYVQRNKRKKEIKKTVENRSWGKASRIRRPRKFDKSYKV